MRGYLGGEVVVDSTTVRLLHESCALPQCWFPVQGVRDDVLTATDRSRDDEHKGRQRLRDARLRNRVVSDAAYDAAEPPDGVEVLVEGRPAPGAG